MRRGPDGLEKTRFKECRWRGRIASGSGWTRFF